MTQKINAFHRLKQQAKLLCTREYKARGIKVNRCELCQLMPEHCICNEAPALSSEVDFILLYHLDELFKPTNTGRLIADCFPDHTFAFLHHRTEPPPALLEFLQDPNRECVIVFPDNSGQQRKVYSPQSVTTNKKLTLVLIDATWRQGRRMFNSSQWLKDCAVLKLDPNEKSIYATRQAACDSYLSTAESTAMALMKIGETNSAATLLDYFQLFNQRYQLIKPRR